MYNTKFILSDNKEIYPGYIDKEQREQLKNQIGQQREVMRCGCKPNGKLYYRISEDLKIYPEHNNYVHDKHCSRYKPEDGKAKRQAAYVINDEDGEVTVFTTFNPKEFTLNDNEAEKEQDNVIPEDEESLDEAVLEKSEEADDIKEDKEPQLSLAGLIRSINVDTYTEKALNNKKIVSKDAFSKNVFYRMQKVRISRMKKKIGELTLEKDGVRFIYLPFFNIIQKTEKGITRCYIQTVNDNREVYNNFIFPKTLEKAVKAYKKNYGIAPDENTMVAGFQYYKKGRGKGYRVIGRVHLFMVSGIGIYCRSYAEKEAYDNIANVLKEDNSFKFWIPPEDDSIGGIIQMQNYEKKVLLLFHGKKTMRLAFDGTEYIPLVYEEGMNITKEMLYELIMDKS